MPKLAMTFALNFSQTLDLQPPPAASVESNAGSPSAQPPHTLDDVLAELNTKAKSMTELMKLIEYRLPPKSISIGSAAREDGVQTLRLRPGLADTAFSGYWIHNGGNAEYGSYYVNGQSAVITALTRAANIPVLSLSGSQTRYPLPKAESKPQDQTAHAVMGNQVEVDLTHAEHALINFWLTAKERQGLLQKTSEDYAAVTIQAAVQKLWLLQLEAAANEQRWQNTFKLFANAKENGCSYQSGVWRSFTIPCSLDYPVNLARQCQNTELAFVNIMRSLFGDEVFMGENRETFLGMIEMTSPMKATLCEQLNLCVKMQTMDFDALTAHYTTCRSFRFVTHKQNPCWDALVGKQFTRTEGKILQAAYLRTVELGRAPIDSEEKYDQLQKFVQSQLYADICAYLPDGDDKTQYIADIQQRLASHVAHRPAGQNPVAGKAQPPLIADLDQAAAVATMGTVVGHGNGAGRLSPR